MGIDNAKDEMARDGRISVETLRELVEFDGAGLVWRERGPEWGARAASFNLKYAGRPALASRKLAHGGLGGNILGVGYTAAQVAFALCNGRWAAAMVACLDGNPLNLSADNLADMRAGEIKIRRRARRPLKSDAAGRVRVKAGSVHLGSFGSAQAAEQAYLGASKARRAGQ